MFNMENWLQNEKVKIYCLTMANQELIGLHVKILIYNRCILIYYSKVNFDSLRSYCKFNCGVEAT